MPRAGHRARTSFPVPAIMAGVGFAGVAGLGKLRGAKMGPTLVNAAVTGTAMGVLNLASSSIGELNQRARSDAEAKGEQLSFAAKAGGITGSVLLMGASYLVMTKGMAGASMNPLRLIVPGANGGGAAAAAGAAAGGATPAGKGMLATFGVDMTEQAAKGEIGRAVGVDEQVDQLVSVLGAKTKNNPLIVGPAGTGKTALVEELAYRINEGNVPEHLKGVKLVKIDLDAMVGGTNLRGQFEARLSGVIKEIEASKGRIVPFIDETHKLVNAGAAGSTEGAGEAVKPVLARGGIRLIGATTDHADEIGQIHGDPALARRFTEIAISAPDEQMTLDIARGAAGRFERPDLVFEDAALRKAVDLTMPIQGRNQPDKVLTLLDTASSRVNIARDGKPQELTRLDREISTLTNELRIVQRESTPDMVARTAQIREELGALTPRRDQLAAGWTEARTCTRA